MLVRVKAVRIVNGHDAKTTLSSMLVDLERGAEVTIARNGKPVAKLVAIPQPVRREPGVLAQDPAWRDFVYGPSVFAPMTDEERVEEGWI